MTTLTVWLLITIGSNAQVVERFDSMGECERVASYMRRASDTRQPVLGCIEARVVVNK